MRAFQLRERIKIRAGKQWHDAIFASRRACKMFIAALAMSTGSSLAQDIGSSAPAGGLKPAETYVCNGYNPVYQTWAPLIPGIRQLDVTCPEHWYIVTVNPITALVGDDSDTVGFRFTCCPAPSDLLTGDHRYELVTCPDNHIVTGERFEASSLVRSEAEFRFAKKRLRCTALSPRYMLSPARGRVLDSLTSLNDEWLDNPLERPELEQKISRFQIPLAIRFAIGRTDGDSYENNWCLGYPWGSVVAGRTSRHCTDFKFQQVVYSGLPSDPPAGTPAPMFPDCVAIEGMNTPTPKCIHRKETPGISLTGTPQE